MSINGSVFKTLRWISSNFNGSYVLMAIKMASIFIAIYLFIDLSMTPTLEYLIYRSGYSSGPITSRIIQYISFCGGIAGAILLLSYKANVVYWLMVLLLFNSGLSNFRYMPPGDIMERLLGAPPLSLILAILLFVAYITPRFIYSKMSLVMCKRGIFFLGFVACFSPFLTGKYLNAESSIDERLSDDLRERIYRTNGSTIHIVLSDEESHHFNASSFAFSAKYPAAAAGEYSLKGVNLEFINTKANISVVCFLTLPEEATQASSPIKMESVVDNISICMSDLRNTYDAENDLLAMLSEKKFISSGVLSQVFSEIIRSNKSEYYTNKKRELSLLLNISTIRGGFFHHYNSIIHTINGKSDIKGLFSNQYGFGPLFLVRELRSAFELKSFDSVILSVLLGNASLLLLIFVLFKNDNRLVYLLAGYSLSILWTLSGSEMMAPFLYPIRYLPTLMLSLFIVKRETVGIVNSRPNLGIQIIIGFVVGAWNFEYGIFTLFSLMLAAVLSRSTNWVYMSLALFFSLLASKVLSHVDHVGSEANYMAYLSGVGQGNQATLVSISYIYIACAFSSVGLLLGWRNKSFSLCMISLLVMACSFKVVWNGSDNHIGPCFLLMASLVCALLPYFQSLLSLLQGPAAIKWRTSFNYKIDTIRSFLNHDYGFDLMLSGESCRSSEINSGDIYRRSCFVISLFLLLLMFMGLNRFPYSKRISFEDYSDSTVSDFYKIPRSLIDKGNDFILLYKNEDQVISPLDNFLAIYSNRNVNYPLVDLSTNINTKGDAIRIIREIRESAVRCIIVDNVLYLSKSRLFSDLSSISVYFDEAISRYEHNRNNLKDVADNILGQGYFVYEENRSFTRYCKR